MESSGDFTSDEFGYQVDGGGVDESHEPSIADPVEEGMVMKARAPGKRAGRLLSPSYLEGPGRNPASHAWRAWEGCGVT